MVWLYCLGDGDDGQQKKRTLTQSHVFEHFVNKWYQDIKKHLSWFLVTSHSKCLIYFKLRDIYIYIKIMYHIMYYIDVHES